MTLVSLSRFMATLPNTICAKGVADKGRREREDKKEKETERESTLSAL